VLFTDFCTDCVAVVSVVGTALFVVSSFFGAKRKKKENLFEKKKRIDNN
jgi:hypothetical protein